MRDASTVGNGVQPPGVNEASCRYSSGVGYKILRSNSTLGLFATSKKNNRKLSSYSASVANGSSVSKQSSLGLFSETGSKLSGKKVKQLCPKPKI